MKSNFPLHGSFASALPRACLLLLVPLATGCHCTASWCSPPAQHAVEVVHWDSMCFGYHSTCWRPWPAECLPCPSPFSLPPLGEVIESPQPDELPAIPFDSAPMPEVPLPAAPMPEASPAPPNLPDVPPSAPQPVGQTSARRHWLDASTATSPAEPALLDRR
ncbi:MAG: hypothetical protein WD872_01440 [Pirellulaceae bacterium]